MRARRIDASSVLLAALMFGSACASSACAAGGASDVEGSADGASDDGGGSDAQGDGAARDGDAATGDSSGGDGDGSLGDADGAAGDGAIDGADSALDDGADGAADASDAGADTATFDTTPPDTGVPLCTVDSDGDTLFDEQEGRFDPAGPIDTDKDGVADYLDTDSDDDGIPDAVEYVTKLCPGDAVVGINDANGNGVPNWRDLDSDGNGLRDRDEACPPAGMPGFPAGCALTKPADFDSDGVMDFLDFDNDHDSPSPDLTLGLPDVNELADDTGKYVGTSLDADADGVPDVYDRDSDDDHIMDLVEGLGDPDKDARPNFRDTDSDGDSVHDVCEARANPSPTSLDDVKPILDTDGDGKPDFLQKDTDDDLLVDGAEDKNDNCVVDVSETDRRKADTDGDGVSDFVEVTLVDVACAKDKTCTPASKGLFYFIEPYSTDGSLKPTPTSSPLALSTKLNQGDVAFVVDTSTSMDGIESNLASSIGSRIIPALASKVPDLNLAVVGYDDALMSPYGGSLSTATHHQDFFMWFPVGSTKTSNGDPSLGSWLTSSTSTAISAAAALTSTSISGDYPEGSVPALWWAITGDAFTFGSSGKSFAAASGVPSDRFGGLHFRKSALPIVVNTSDANFHNGLTTSCGGLSPCPTIAYGVGDASASSLGHSPKLGELKDELNALGAKYIGVSVHGGAGKSTGIDRDATTLARYGSTVDMLYLARNTASKVPPSALGGTTTDCKTEDPAATLSNPADADGLCPLVFDIQYSGTGLGDVVVNGVIGLLNAITFDVHVQAYDDVTTPGAVDDFMLEVHPQPTGGTDPVTGGICVTFPAAKLADDFVGPKALVAGADGVFDTITALNPGSLYCFDVVPKPNTSVVAKTTPQIFRAWLRVLAIKPSGGTYSLGVDREVLFLVPPIVN